MILCCSKPISCIISQSPNITSVCCWGVLSLLCVCVCLFPQVWILSIYRLSLSQLWHCQGFFCSSMHVSFGYTADGMGKSSRLLCFFVYGLFHNIKRNTYQLFLIWLKQSRLYLREGGPTVLVTSVSSIWFVFQYLCKKILSKSIFI